MIEIKLSGGDFHEMIILVSPEVYNSREVKVNYPIHDNMLSMYCAVYKQVHSFTGWVFDRVEEV